jgi:hypothetical protein
MREIVMRKIVVKMEPGAKYRVPETCVEAQGIVLQASFRIHRTPVNEGAL